MAGSHRNSSSGGNTYRELRQLRANAQGTGDQRNSHAPARTAATAIGPMVSERQWSVSSPTSVAVSKKAPGSSLAAPAAGGTCGRVFRATDAVRPKGARAPASTSQPEVFMNIL